MGTHLKENMKKGVKEYKAYFKAHRGRFLSILLIILIVVLAFMILDEKYTWTGQAIKEQTPNPPVDEITQENSGYQDITVSSTS